MQVDEAGYVESRAEVSADERERHGHPAGAAPFEHQPLSRRQDLARDPGEAARVTTLEGIHAGVVEAEIERLPPIDVPQGALHRGQVRFGARHDLQPRPRARLVAVHPRHGDVELMDSGLVRDEARRAAPAVRVEIQHEHRSCPVIEDRARGQHQTVEGAERRTTVAPRVVHPARQRARDSVRDRRSRGGQDAAVAREHHAPQSLVPREALRLGPRTRHAVTHRVDVRRIVHACQVIDVERRGRDEAQPRER